MSSVTNVNVSFVDTKTERVEKVIQKFVDEGKSFTVLDVSNEVKQDGGEFIRHRDIRPIVYKIIDTESISGLEDYMNTLIQVNTPRGTQYARLYHLEDEDTEEYKHRQQKALSPSEISKNDKSDTVDDKSVKNDQLIKISGAHVIKFVNKRKDGAIEIPVKILSKSFNNYECELEIQNHPNSITIKSLGQVSNYATANRISREGMRIFKRTLEKSNLTKKSLTVCSFTNKIVIF
ncbi:MAG: hypothetical protein ACOC56_05815 [Atribacterota bacterium]